MITIINNKYNLSESDITEVVKRVKVLLINSKNELLLGYSHNNYQFPGGHVEEKETFWQTVLREIKEETGIKIECPANAPFAETIGYYKDWPEEGKNRKIEIYYYEIITDERPNLEKTDYTKNEKDGNFELRYVHLSRVEKELKDNIQKHGDKKGIAREMLELLKEYKINKKGD